MKSLKFFFLLFIFQNAEGQTLNREELMKKLSISSNTIFILNGEFFNVGDSLTLDKKLSNIDSNHIIQITKLTEKSKLELRTTNDVLIISYATQKKIEENKTQLKKAKKILSKNPKGKIRLYINNEEVPKEDALKKVSNLNLKDIIEVLIRKNVRNEIKNQDADSDEFIKIWIK